MHLKQLFDFVAASMLMVILSPLMVMVGALVKLTLGSPVIFRQKRPGFNGRPFVMYKFRSLADRFDGRGNLLPDRMRFTRFSDILRKSSLDELPELINVLKGEMSLVGPRPLLMQYLGRYNSEQARRHLVKPGITGWAQVNGRNAISWQEKFRLDVWYVDHHNFRLDLKILWLTMIRVCRRHGVQQQGQVTAEEFMGNENHVQ